MQKIKSPLYYNGSKYTLLDYLKYHIPENKDGVFYDVFGGSGVVSLNFSKYYNKAIYADKTTWIYKIFKWSLTIDSQQKETELHERILKYDEKYKFILHKDLRGGYDLTKLPEYKGWIKFIDQENITAKSDPALLYIASCFAFSHTLKFRKNGKLHKSWGVKGWSYNFITSFRYAATRKNIECHNRGFEEFPFQDLDPVNDFVYLDPPYYGTDANYNKFWDMEQEKKLLEFYEKLNSMGVKVAMSNVFDNKGKSNDHLKEWCYKNKWTVYERDHVYNINGATGAATEVLICNYEYDIEPKQLQMEL